MTAEGETVRAIENKQPYLDLRMQSWGSHRMMIGLRQYDCEVLPLTGLFDAQDRLLAAASWTVEGDVGILCSLHALQPGTGAAMRLLAAIQALARAEGAVRLRAMVTNDNMPAMMFYQKQGFRFSGLYVDTIDAYRSVVPSIIETGYQGIAVRDAIELEIAL